MSREALRARLVAHLEKIGYPLTAAQFICNRLTTIANMYNDSEAALNIIVENMKAKITGPFNDEQLSRFVMEINPTRTPWHLYEKHLGISPDEVDSQPPQEQDQYWQEKRQLDRQLSALRRADLSLLRNSEAWEILSQHNWREIQPSLGLHRQIKSDRPISTPLGGQPGYKRRSKHS